MTGRTAVHDPRVTKYGPGKRRSGLVTGIARSRGRNMIRSFSKSHRPVVARGATARCHTRMAERRRDPPRRAVTGIAGLRRRYVRRRLAPRCRPVMARGATTRRHPRMAERRRNPRRRPVARIARLRRRYVRRRLAPHLGPVMTGRTAARHHPRVIVACADKQPVRHAHSVAAVAGSGCHQMPSRLPTGLNPVMASHTGTGHDAKMFEGSSRPTHGPVTTVTGHSRWNMSRRLAARGRWVMAFGTGSRSHPIVRKERGGPIRRPMAAVAIDSSRYVTRWFERGHDSPAGRVTLHTLRGSSPKDTLQVAALTVDLRMAAGEWKAGAAVIDFNVRAAASLGRHIIRHQQHRAAYRQKP